VLLPAGSLLLFYFLTLPSPPLACTSSSTAVVQPDLSVSIIQSRLLTLDQNISFAAAGVWPVVGLYLKFLACRHETCGE
jgi:hypothetical protein